MVRWIKTPPLDAKSIMPPKILMTIREFRSVRNNGEMTKMTPPPTCVILNVFAVLTTIKLVSQNYIFSPRAKEKN